MDIEPEVDFYGEGVVKDKYADFLNEFIEASGLFIEIESDRNYI
jgi:hypothetical protein